MRSPNLLTLVAAGAAIGACIGVVRGPRHPAPLLGGDLAREAVARPAPAPIAAAGTDAAPRALARLTLAAAPAAPKPAASPSTPPKPSTTSSASTHAGAARREAPKPAEGRAEAVLRASRAVLASAGVESGPQGAQVQRALARLGGRVRETSDRDALRLAFRAYYAIRA